METVASGEWRVVRKEDRGGKAAHRSENQNPHSCIPRKNGAPALGRLDAYALQE